MLPGEKLWWEREIADAPNQETAAVLKANYEKFGRWNEALRTQYFISCWNMEEHETYAMWRCYTKSRNSVAIRTTFQKLRSALPSSVLIGMVRYTDLSHLTAPSMNMLSYATTKLRYYSFEHEIRALRWALQMSEEEEASNVISIGTIVGYAPVVQLQDLIDAVFVHPQASKRFIAWTTEVCKRNGLPAPQVSGVLDSTLE